MIVDDKFLDKTSEGLFNNSRGKKFYLVVIKHGSSKKYLIFGNKMTWRSKAAASAALTSVIVKVLYQSKFVLDNKWSYRDYEFKDFCIYVKEQLLESGRVEYEEIE